MMPEPAPELPHITTRPLKVMQIASGDLWAGAEKQLYVLATTLQRQGVDVSAALMNPGPLADKLQAAGIPTQVFDESRQGSREILAGLRRHLRQIRPDVVHTHRTKENILGGIAAATLGIPSIRTQHGAQEHSASLLDLRRQVLTKADWLVGKLLQRQIVAVSPVLETELARTFGRKKVVQIPNGLDIGGQLPARHWGPKPIWTIGIVGRQVPVKRVDLFLRAARQLETLMPDQGFHFQIVGDGPLAADNQQLARELGFMNPVEFTGHVDNAEAAIASLDLLVICSDHEGLPMVALEAMRAGTVIVTHAIGALPELLDAERGGIFVPAQTPDGFADGLQTALQDPAQLARLCAQARQRLETVYSDQAMAAAYQRTYRQLAPMSK